MAKTAPKGYMIDVGEHEKLEKETKGTSTGIFCPKRNESIKKRCFVCEETQRLFGTNNQKDRDMAFKLMAKANFYMNVVLPENPEKVMILEVGKKAGSSILNGINKKSWTDIANPIKGEGRDMEITKQKGDGGYNSYDPSPVLQNADWSVPSKALDNLPNLSNIFEILADKDFLGHELFRISDIKMDETLRFRICPPWDNGSESDPNRRIMTVVWRHFGVTQDQIEGKEEISLALPSEDTSDNDVPFDTSAEQPTTSSEPEPVTDKQGREACFGDPKFFEPDEETCNACKDRSDCKAQVVVNLKSNK